METKNENYGLIYVLTNEFMPNLVKIGKTTKETIEDRLRALYYGNTGVPANFKCVRTYRIPLDKLDSVERKLHDYFSEQRVNPNREFFKIEPEEVDKLFYIYNEVADDTAEVQNVLDSVTAEDDFKEVKHKNPNMDFFEMGLGVGSVLIYNNDEGIRCNVIEAKKVEYNGTTYSLSNLTHQLLGTKHAVRPAPLWHTEDGKSLLQLYNETLAAQLSANDSAIAAANAEYDQFKTDCQ